MDQATEKPVFDAVLYPHRSLSPRGFALLMAGVATAAGTVALWFTAAGAWPVLPFFGGEILLIWWAFRANSRDARTFETLELTSEALTVAHVRPSGHRTEHRFAPPHWLKVLLLPRAGGDNELQLTSHGRSLVIGRFLSPDERRDLAGALQAALRRIRV